MMKTVISVYLMMMVMKCFVETTFRDIVRQINVTYYIYYFTYCCCYFLPVQVTSSTREVLVYAEGRIRASITVIMTH